MVNVHPPPSQIGFAPVKPHGFPTFLNGKTTVFPTPFPDFQSTLRVLPPKGDKIPSTLSSVAVPLLNLSTVGGEGNF